MIDECNACLRTICVCPPPGVDERRDSRPMIDDEKLAAARCDGCAETENLHVLYYCRSCLEPSEHDARAKTLDRLREENLMLTASRSALATSDTAERDVLRAALDEARAEAERRRSDLDKIGHEIGICYCHDNGCGGAGPVEAIVEAINRARRDAGEGDDLRSALARKEAECASLRAHLVRLNFAARNYRSIAEEMKGGGVPQDVIDRADDALTRALAASPSTALDAVREAQRTLVRLIERAIGNPGYQEEADQALVALARVFGETT